MKLPFNKPYMTGNEFTYIQQAIDSAHLSGNGHFTRQCQAWLEETFGTKRALLVHSGTSALELAAILLDIEAGDEVIMPSFTFVSTANAFVLRGAVPVFVDIRPDVLNIDESLIEAAITPRTKAICPVHYGGVGCEMDSIIELANRYDLAVVEDAAHGFAAQYKGRPLGSLSSLAAFSFHETKNVHCGEGGALLINDERFIDRAEVLVEKGTDRRKFMNGLVDKYTWQDLGSSFLPSEVEAAFLWAQFLESDRITKSRLEVWHHYHQMLEPLERSGYLRRPMTSSNCTQNAHLYYILLESRAVRDDLLTYLNCNGINAVFHYVPLHSSPGGKHFGRAHGQLNVTEDLSGRLLRLPLWIGMDENHVSMAVEAIDAYFAHRGLQSATVTATSR